MNRIFSFASISFFSIFLGSQITEGFLLVPYWKALSVAEFYEYYATSGPIIGRFYTILTIVSVLIPISISIYFFSKKRRGLKYAVIASFFSLLVIVLFYAYFKDTNQQFYDMAYNANQLKSVLNNWEYYHWLRVLFEFLSLVYLIQALTPLRQKKQQVV